MHKVRFEEKGDTSRTCKDNNKAKVCDVPAACLCAPHWIKVYPNRQIEWSDASLTLQSFPFSNKGNVFVFCSTFPLQIAHSRSSSVLCLPKLWLKWQRKASFLSGWWILLNKAFLVSPPPPQPNLSPSGGWELATVSQSSCIFTKSSDSSSLPAGNTNVACWVLGLKQIITD